MFFMSGSGFHVSGSVFIDVALQLLVPFILGQIARLWRPIAKMSASPVTKNVDRLSIAFVVYGAFSEGIVLGVWTSIAWWQLVIVVLLSLILVELMLWLTWTAASRFGFDYGDRVAIQFCGTKKSLATGLPMAAVIFPQSAAVIILPLMVFHQIQLMVCSVRASRYARQWTNTPPARRTRQLTESAEAGTATPQR